MELGNIERDEREVDGMKERWHRAWMKMNERRNINLSWSNK